MEYTEEKVKEIVETQRKYFKTNETLDVNFRIQQLQKLKQALIDNEELLEDALHADLNRSKTEAYLTDIGPTILEINETIHGLRRWARPELHLSGVMSFPSIFTKVYKMPYGVTLIFSPFNFPILLTLGVAAAAIAGGNTIVIKPSSKSKECTKALEKIIAETFDPKYITVVAGGHDTADLCLAQRFDKIFYTGSPAVAKHVMEEAAKNLTPVALELGGETGNYCIVRKDADLKDAARKIAFFKSLNAGQICININQVAVAKEVAKEFIEELKIEFKKHITEDPVNNEDYPKLIDERAYIKCENTVNQYKDKIVYGGKGDLTTQKFEPTILYPIDIDDEIVNRELFAPILPIIEFDDDKVEDLLNVIQDREHPLAMYIFTSDIPWAEKAMQTLQYGGGCINEVCVHLMVKGVPFNGTGHSGMGAYHGEWGFKEFTHPQTVLKGNTKMNLSIREQPYTKLKYKLIKIFER